MYAITLRIYGSNAVITKPTGRGHDFQFPVCVESTYRLNTFTGEAL